MVWRNVEIMDEKLRFLERLEAGKDSISQLCREFKISREAGYRLIRRYRKEGARAAVARSKRPLRNPKELSGETVCEIISARMSKPSWGARKLQKVLERQGLENIPSVRSINRVLEKSGLIEKRRRRRQRAYYPEKVVRPRECNDVWTIDVKGWWITKDQKRCYPLTIRDEKSKYILDIVSLTTVTTETVKASLIKCFRRYGLPKYIRSDNGAPFSASLAVQGLSELSAWWISLGITPNRIPLASPQYNGAHERMHRDMKKELQKTPAKNAKAQQHIFDVWRDEYNKERPHESLGMDTPATHYKLSKTKLPETQPSYNYDEKIEKRKVGKRGEIWWQGHRYFVSGALTRKIIGIKKEKDESYSVWYNDFFLGKTDLSPAFPLRGTSFEEAKRNKVSTLSWH